MVTIPTGGNVTEQTPTARADRVQRPDRLYAELVASLYGNRHAVIAAMNHNRKLASVHDGWPARGDSVGRSSLPHSPVEAAAGACLNLERDAVAMRTAIDRLKAAEAALMAVVRRYAPQAVTDLPDRCNGGQGVKSDVDTWQRPECEQVPSVLTRKDGTQGLAYYGLCDACYRRKLRHEAGEGCAA